MGTWHIVKPLPTCLGRVGFLPGRGCTEGTQAGLPEVNFATSQALPTEGKPWDRQETGAGLIFTDITTDYSMITTTPCSPGHNLCLWEPPPVTTRVQRPLWWVEGCI